MNAKVKDMSGIRYASIVAIAPAGKVSSGDLLWSFLCDCGNEFKANGYNARSGKITTCPACSQKRNGKASITHGLSHTPEFRVWTDIQTRCHNKNYREHKYYGDRGIIVCQRWRDSFENFLEDMGKRPSNKHSIDRFPDNDGNYEPGNCRWATIVEQANNKRSNHNITIDGITKTLAEWCKETGSKQEIVRYRHRNGVVGRDLFKTMCQQISYQGITDTVPGWARRVGLKPSTLWMRLSKYGWPTEKALTKGSTSCA